MKKVQPSEQKRKQLEELFVNDTPHIIEDFQRRAQERVIQEALEAEVSDRLGRKWYEHSGTEKAHQGHRNGYYRHTAKTSSERLDLRVPRVRNTPEPFVSKVLRSVVHLAEKLKQRALEMYVRGLSTRDIEDVFVDSTGQALLSRSAVSRLSECLYEEYQAFSQRDLASLDVVYLFADGVYESVKRYTDNQTLLCAWAICADGTKQLLHIAAMESESRAAWEMFFDDMLKRGLRQPLLVISDGAKGIHAAIERSFPKADRQRCLAHKLRNIQAKLPREVAKLIVEQVKQVYYAADRTSAETLAAQFIGRHAAIYPAAVQCFSEDLDACLTHLNYPLGHRRFIRTTNLLERAFEEQKRRTKVFPQHQSERAAIGLVFAVLKRTSDRWLRVSMSQLELVQLKTIRALKCPTENDSHFISYRIAA
jgi:transposase-like protein